MKSEADILADVHWDVRKKDLQDCKAFAFECLRRLLNRGITGQFVACQTETGEYHAIAVVGGAALDLRQRNVKSVGELRKMGYQIARLAGEV